MKSLKKLLTASIMLVVALVAVVSSTFAWFTTSNPLQVSGLDINVQESTGVYMSIDYNSSTPANATWLTSLNATHFRTLNTFVGSGSTDERYSPVCAPLNTDGSLNLGGTFQKVQTSITSHTLVAAEAGQDYSKISIYLYADSETTLNVNSLAVVATDQATGGVNYAATSMLRVAFVSPTATKIYKQFSDDISGVGVTSSALIGANTYPSFYSSLNPAFDSFVNTGVLGTPTTADATTGVRTAAIGNATYASYASLFNEGNTSYGDVSNLTNMITLPANQQVVQLDLYIWLEGWDSLCTDQLDGTSYSFNFILTPTSLTVNP